MCSSLCNYTVSENSNNTNAIPMSIARLFLPILLLLQQHISHCSSNISTSSQLRSLQHLFSAWSRGLGSLFLLHLPLSDVIEELAAELLGETLIRGAVCFIAGVRWLSGYIVHIDCRTLVLVVWMGEEAETYAGSREEFLQQVDRAL